MGFMATVNVPGYLPEDDDPPVFDTPQEAWGWLADERESAEDLDYEYDPADPDAFEYSEIVLALRHLSANPTDHDVFEGVTGWLDDSGGGVLYSHSPGRRYSNTDLGLAYIVTLIAVAVEESECNCSNPYCQV